MEQHLELVTAGPWEGYRCVKQKLSLKYAATVLRRKDGGEVKKLKVTLPLGDQDGSMWTTSMINLVSNFFDAVERSPCLTHLALPDCSIDNRLISKHFAGMIKNNTSITHLKLTNNNIGDEGVGALFEALEERGKPLEELSLKSNVLITPKAATAMAENGRLWEIKSLDLSFSNALGAEGIHQIEKTTTAEIVSGSKLSKLNLSGVFLGDEGAQSLASILKRTKKSYDDSSSLLSELILSDCGIREYGCKELCEALEEFPLIETLDLSKNHLGDGGLPFISKLICQSTSLKKLNLKLCQFSRVEFGGFLEQLLVAYDNLGTAPLTELNISKNGLGDETVPLITRVLRHKFCLLTKLGYDGNGLTNDGFKEFAKFFAYQFDHDALQDFRNRSSNKKLVDSLGGEENFLNKLTLKDNDITSDGIEEFTKIVGGKFNQMRHLDLRKNKIELKGARMLKKFFLKQHIEFIPNFKFELAIFPNDVGGPEGINELMIGMRSAEVSFVGGQAQTDLKQRYLLRKLVEHGKKLDGVMIESSEPNEVVVVDDEELEDNIESIEATQLAEGEKAKDKEDIDDPHNEDFSVEPLTRNFKKYLLQKKTRYGIADIWFGAYILPFKKFYLNVADRKMILTGLSETKVVDTLDLLYDEAVVMNCKCELLWNPSAWDAVKDGYGSVVADCLYRHGLILRFLELNRESFTKYRYFGSLEIENKLLEQSPLYDRKSPITPSKKYWDQLIKQKSPKSEGLTMFEYAIKYSCGPVIDVLRQFAFIFPVNTGNLRIDRTPFPFARLGTRTIQEICLESSDQGVRRWACAKRLIEGRFSVVEDIYRSKNYYISKCEDLFNTEDEVDDRMYYIKHYPSARGIYNGPSLPDIERLVTKEIETYRQFEVLLTNEDVKLSGRPLSDSLVLRENWKLKSSLGDFYATISAIGSPTQFTPEVFIWKPYVKTLRQVIDDEGIANGGDISQIRHIAECVANSLLALNLKETWTARIVHALDKPEEDPLDRKDNEPLRKLAENRDEKSEKERKVQVEAAKEKCEALKNRVHGNLKPRNIVLIDHGEVGSGKNTEEFEHWGVMDFSLSAYHDEEITPTVYGNSAYMPPEIARKVLSYEVNHTNTFVMKESVDAWSFGCVLYELLAGVPLFQMEYREDSILRKSERAELVNWVRLDDERKALILRDLEEDDQIRQDAINLVAWCLNGDPKNRPSIAEIRTHPFLMFRTKQDKRAPDDALGKLILHLQSISKEAASDTKVHRHNHVHVINCNFHEAHTVVHALKEFLYSVGCRMTTDVIGENNSMETVENNAGNARVVLCLLSKETFTTPLVVLQLIRAHKVYLERCSSTKFSVNADVKSVSFLEIGGNQGKNKFDKSLIMESMKWAKSDGFAYLVTGLASDKAFAKEFKEESMFNADEDTIRDVLVTKYHPIFFSMLKMSFTFYPQKFLREAMLADVLRKGNLQGPKVITAYEASRLEKGNFDVKLNLTDAKLLKEKPQKSAFFMPEVNEKTRKYPHRVIILEGSFDKEWTNEAISEIAAALQSHGDEEKEEDDKKYRLKRERVMLYRFTKVLNSKKVKKMTSHHLPSKPRVTRFNKMYDAVKTWKKDTGKLVVITVIDKGFADKYVDLLEEYEEERGDELVIVPVHLSMSSSWEKAYEELLSKIKSPPLRKKFADKTRFIPYHKKADIMEHTAEMAQVASVASALTKLKKPLDQGLAYA